MKIFYIRHGQTDWNVKKIVQGTTDIPLNKTGIMQAKEAQKKVMDKNINLILSSPLSRAKETAEIINEVLGVELILDERLRERNYGTLEGKSHLDINDGEVWCSEHPETLENLNQVFERISGFLDDIKIRYADRTILVVSHGGTTSAFNWYFDKCSYLNRNTRVKVFENCELKEYELI